MSNSSSVSGTKLSASTAESSELCRVSGYLYDIHGNPVKSQKITLRNIHDPALYGSTITIVKEYQTVRTSSAGLLTFDAYQGGKIKVELPGRVLDRILVCNIPEATSANLNDILFPYIVSVALDSDDASVSLSVGESHSYTATATLSDGQTVDVSGYLTMSSSDTDVVTVSSNAATAVAVGTSSITITDVDTDELEVYQEPDGDVISRLSEPSITFPDAVTVTVS